ncbi:protein argonaute 2 isoform X2 [Cryptomeria japonica]|uniref:protein argonaute 2 isoform X2 n=1 Tax=Cryptomeria japonica TaxID=3369 RepID=UPI0027DA8A7F|nr:protein argonaute 2 isoform X2 [Cryptomeria japonica]
MERGGNRGRGRGRGRGDEQWRQQAPQGSGQGRGQGWGRGRAGGVEPGPNYAGAAGFQPGSGQSSQRGGPSQAAPVGQGRGQGPPQAWGPQAWGRGRQQQQQFAPRPSVPPGSAIEETSRQMARVNIQEPLAPVNIPQGSGTSISTSAGSSIEKLDSGNLKPVKRPDAGGRNGSRQVRLIANHFKVEFQPNQQIFHYDVNITRASAKNGASKRGGKQKGGRGASTSEGQDLAATVSRADAEEIKNKLVAENRVAFRDAKPVYDGKKNLYSAIELPEGDFTVKLSKGEDSEAKEYKVTLTLANKLDGRRLADFLNRSIRDHVTVQQEMLQALDLVVREHPSSSRIIMGRSLYEKDKTRQEYLNSGIVAARGFSMSLRPTAQGLSLNVDFSVVAFHATMPVLDYLWENRKIDCKPNQPLNPNDRRAAESALRGLKVTVTHRLTKQKYTVGRLTKETTRELRFNIEESGQQNQSVSLVDYYRKRYNEDIKFKLLPCLDLSKQSDRPNYVPMEFCVICEGQRFPKDNLNAIQQKNLRGMACPKVYERQNIINQIMSMPDGPRGGPYLPHFQIAVGAEMTEVTARVLDAPELRLGDRGQLSRVMPRPDDRQWNLLKSHVFDGKNIERWGIIHFSQRQPDKQTGMAVEIFCDAMVKRFRTLGINMQAKPVIYKSDAMAKFDNVAQLKQTLTDIHTRSRGQGQLQILICIMEDKHPGYKSLKLICETEIGLVTQCCLWEHVRKCGDTKYGSQYLANFALKVNAKVGGSNAALNQSLSTQLPRFGNHHVVYFGADVNHPGKRDERSPSIAAVVMSINWPHSNRYVVKIRCQKNRQEYISELGDMSKELLDEYLKMNKKLPERIIFFRDGVSEGQFDIVLNQELVALKKAFKQFGNYNPVISFIVAQKRHHTRLFPLGDVNTKSGNVPPGTVVDTSIVHPREFDFYLCSHYGLLGTSKPTHYHVLWDENLFSSDELQQLINNLCYTFARCTKPVSLVPPVYYADLAAYRGRLYVEGLTTSDTSSASSSSSSASFSIPKINVGVENFMFFL